MQAEQAFKKVLEINPDNFAANFELGLYYNDVWMNREKALPYFLKAESLMPKDTVYELLYQLGASYHYFSNFDKAIVYYKNFKKALQRNASGTELRRTVDSRIKQCEFGIENKNSKFKGEVKNLGEGVNSPFAEYCAVILRNGTTMLYTKRDENSLGKFSFDYQHHEDVYLSKSADGTWTKSVPLQDVNEMNNFTNSDFHDAIVAASTSQDTVVLFKKNLLLYSIKKNGSWGVPVPFSDNINISKYQRHACFSHDGKTIYFTSDSKKGNGGYDIYKSTADDKGNWLPAQNLGTIVNTEGDEDSPFISADGKRLYFSSKGHLGYGGYDVFYVDISDSVYSNPVNVGMPVNSPADDIFFNPENIISNEMYFSSSRAGGMGNMDIYVLTTVPETQECLVYDYVNNSFKTGPSSVVSNDKMHLKLDLPAHVEQDQFFELSVISSQIDGFKTKEISWTFPNRVKQTGKIIKLKIDSICQLTVDLQITAVDSAQRPIDICISTNIEVLKKKEVAVAVVPDKVVAGDKNITDYEEVNGNLKLENIYFDFDKSDLDQSAKSTLDKNIKVLKDNPDLVIKIAAHTDSKGSDAYNVKLSARRAKAAVEYYVNHGISRDRIIAVISKGESSPAAQNTLNDGSDNPSGRQMNRRDEFTLLRKKATNRVS